MLKKAFRVITVLLIISIFLTACGPSATPTLEEPTTPAEEPHNPLKNPNPLRNPNQPKNKYRRSQFISGHSCRYRSQAPRRPVN